MNPGAGGEQTIRRGVIAVIRREFSFLVIRRSLTESAQGKLCFPGGSVERGESEEAALIREVEEEVGIVGAIPIRRHWECTTPSGILLGWWDVEIPAVAEPVANPQEVSEFFWWTEKQMRMSSDLLTTNLAYLEAMSSTRGPVRDSGKPQTADDKN